MAICENTLSSYNNDNKKALYRMKRSVPATLWHSAEMPDNQEGNSFCPSEYSSWCKYWQDGGSQNY